ncbi:MAG: hypothetical protein AAF708_00015 [Deinococcota bacterium]
MTTQLWVLLVECYQFHPQGQPASRCLNAHHLREHFPVTNNQTRTSAAGSRQPA